MRRTNNQLRLVADSLAASTKLTDTFGNPSERYNWRHLAAVRRCEWQHEFRHPTIDPFELTSVDIHGIEAQARKELY